MMFCNPFWPFGLDMVLVPLTGCPFGFNQVMFGLGLTKHPPGITGILELLRDFQDLCKHCTESNKYNKTDDRK